MQPTRLAVCTFRLCHLLLRRTCAHAAHDFVGIVRLYLLKAHSYKSALHVVSVQVVVGVESQQIFDHKRNNRVLDRSRQTQCVEVVLVQRLAKFGCKLLNHALALARLRLANDGAWCGCGWQYGCLIIIMGCNNFVQQHRAAKRLRIRLARRPAVVAHNENRGSLRGGDALDVLRSKHGPSTKLDVRSMPHRPRDG